MATIVERRDGRVQAWFDDTRDYWHLVGFTQEPNKVFCKETPMWNYRPTWVGKFKITCPKCKLFMTPEFMVQHFPTHPQVGQKFTDRSKGDPVQYEWDGKDWNEV